VILAQVELDGSFVDAQMQGKSYSTAMAVLTLIEDLKRIGSEAAGTFASRRSRGRGGARDIHDVLTHAPGRRPG
jgi:hypothetical protein